VALGSIGAAALLYRLLLRRRMSRAPWIFGGGRGVIVTSLRR
jgi:hypothetical protein